ncbi:hypothetical protein [Streptomyces lavendulae]|uniref:hypothetical protein n=1 Tax=Streptomyces lavendulae TaxID=1914 RepID=UPI0036EEDAD4
MSSNGRLDRELVGCEEGRLNSSPVSNHRASGGPRVAVLRADGHAGCLSASRGPAAAPGAGVSGAVRSQNRIDPLPGDHPLLPFLLGSGRLGLDTVGLLTQVIDPTPSSKLVLFQ